MKGKDLVEKALLLVAQFIWFTVSSVLENISMMIGELAAALMWGVGLTIGVLAALQYTGASKLVFHAPSVQQCLPGIFQ